MLNSTILPNFICNSIFIKPLFINYDTDVIYAKKILNDIEYNILLKEKGLQMDSDKILQDLNDKYDTFIFKLNMEYTKLNDTKNQLGFCGTSRTSNEDKFYNNIESSTNFNKIYYKKCVIDYIMSLKN